MPSRSTASSDTSYPKATPARMAALAAASNPSTSAVGSRSARPSAWASASTDGVVGPLLPHLGEDEVGRPVDDAHDPVDPLTGERLAQRPHQRDGTGHRGLVQQVHAALAGQGPQRHAVGRGQQRLVGRDHRPAGVERGPHQAPGRFEPADQLDHHVDRRDRPPARRRRWSAGPAGRGPGGGRRRSWTAMPAIVEPGARLHGQGLGPVLQDAHQGGPDVAAAEDGDAHVTGGRGRRGHPVTLPPRDGVGDGPRAGRVRRPVGPGRRGSRDAPPSGPRRRPRRPRPAGGPCCSWRPSSGRRPR